LLRVLTSERIKSGHSFFDISLIWATSIYPVSDPLNAFLDLLKIIPGSTKAAVGISSQHVVNFVAGLACKLVLLEFLCIEERWFLAVFASSFGYRIHIDDVFAGSAGSESVAEHLAVLHNVSLLRLGKEAIVLIGSKGTIRANLYAMIRSPVAFAAWALVTKHPGAV